MVPENKQQQHSTVDTLWTRLSFILRRSSKLRATHRTNWQSELMCNWAVAHFTEPVISSAAQITRRCISHITMAHFQHAVFGTYYFSPCKCNKKKNTYCYWGLLAFEGLSWHVYDEWDKKQTFSSNSTVVNKRLSFSLSEAIGAIRNTIVD